MKAIIKIMVMGLLLSGCGERSTLENSTGGKTNPVEKVIVKHTEAMTGKPWEHKTYQNILDKEINDSKLTDFQKDGLVKKLEVTYSQVIIDEATDIMNNRCAAGTHKRLNESMLELEKHKTSKAYAQTREAYDHHQREMSAASGLFAKQPVSSWRAKYDESADARIRKTAAEHLAMHPACAYLKEAFSPAKADAAVKSRRARFAADITDLYCKGAEWSAKDEADLLMAIKGTLKSKVPDELQTKIDAFREEHQKL